FYSGSFLNDHFWLTLSRPFTATPDTVITFNTKERIMVRESVEEINKRILEYQRSVYGALPPAYNLNIRGQVCNVSDRCA
ncbi:MAG: flagellar FlbD family protein, partial [Deltaproteobacteria bacterium]|nr:flagellar FlbD family protein [Deltaproteobacteria bacterium]